MKKALFLFSVLAIFAIVGCKKEKCAICQNAQYYYVLPEREIDTFYMWIPNTTIERCGADYDTYNNKVMRYWVDSAGNAAIIYSRCTLK